MREAKSSRKRAIDVVLRYRTVTDYSASVAQHLPRPGTLVIFSPRLLAARLISRKHDLRLTTQHADRSLPVEPYGAFARRCLVRSFFKTIIAISILLSACEGGDPEEQVLGAFFSAVQKGDQVGVQRVSLATFDGKPQSWEIVERGPESDAPFQLTELEAQLKSKRDEVTAQREGNASFISDNSDTYEAYKKKYAEDPSAPFKGALLAFHEQLQERQKHVAQLEADADQLGLDVEALKNAATLSLRTPVDTSFEGQIKVKPLQVSVNDGSGDKTYTVVLHRYDLVDTAQNRTPTPQWIIAEIQPHS
jgi:hypothetical protein